MTRTRLSAPHVRGALLSLFCHGAIATKPSIGIAIKTPNLHFPLVACFRLDQDEAAPSLSMARRVWGRNLHNQLQYLAVTSAHCDFLFAPPRSPTVIVDSAQPALDRVESTPLSPNSHTFGRHTSSLRQRLPPSRPSSRVPANHAGLILFVPRSRHCSSC